MHLGANTHSQQWRADHGASRITSNMEEAVLNLANSRNKQVLTSCQGPGNGPGSQKEEVNLQESFCHQGTRGLVGETGVLTDNPNIRPK